MIPRFKSTVDLPKLAKLLVPYCKMLPSSFMIVQREIPRPKVPHHYSSRPAVWRIVAIKFQTSFSFKRSKGIISFKKLSSNCPRMNSIIKSEFVFAAIYEQLISHINLTHHKMCFSFSGKKRFQGLLWTPSPTYFRVTFYDHAGMDYPNTQQVVRLIPNLT